MAKLIVSRPGVANAIHHIPDNEESLVVGRQAGCALLLDGAGVSKEHATIRRVGNDHILEDSGSTNGTRVNGELVARRILQDRDVIGIGDFSIQYINHRAPENMDFDRTMLYEGASPARENGAAREIHADTTRHSHSARPAGVLRRLGGEGPDTVLSLHLVLHTLGDPSGTMAAVLRRPQGYTLMHVRGSPPTRVNGKPLGEEWHDLAAEDQVEVGETRYVFTSPGDAPASPAKTEDS